MTEPEWLGSVSGKRVCELLQVAINALLNHEPSELSELPEDVNEFESHHEPVQ